MPDDSGGVFSLVAGYLAISGQAIQPSQHNPPLEDVANSLTARLMRNGAAPMTDDLKMGDNQIKDLANGTLATDAAAVAQLTGMPGDARKLAITVTGHSAVSISADFLTVISTGLDVLKISGISETLDPSVLGAGGRDTGAEAANTLYAVYILHNVDSGDTTAICSTNFEYGIAYPSGYTHAAYVGAIHNNEDSNLWRTVQNGKLLTIKVGTLPVDETEIVYNSGESSLSGDAVDLTVGVPPNADPILSIGMQTGSDSVILFAEGATAAVLAQVGTIPLEVHTPDHATSLVYYSGNASGYVSVRGWRER